MRDDKICLATMLDSARLQALIRQTNAWPGAIAAAILASSLMSHSSWQQDYNAAATALESMANHEHRVRLVLVENTGYECPPRFPFNLLRNIALSFCIEPYVLALDVDFVPLPFQAGYSALLRLTSTPPMRSPNTALVLPAFDLVRDLPEWQMMGIRGKRWLLEMVKNRSIVPFGSVGGAREVWLPGHACTAVTNRSDVS